VQCGLYSMAGRVCRRALPTENSEPSLVTVHACPPAAPHPLAAVRTVPHMQGGTPCLYTESFSAIILRFTGSPAVPLANTGVLIEALR
jgi:hypothetical protein